MDYDPFHIAALKSKLSSTEMVIQSLQSELHHKSEERMRMESQIIQLSEEMASKNQTIFELQSKIQFLEHSIKSLTHDVAEKKDSVSLVDFLKAELEKREKEVIHLTREHDLLNWKLMNEAPTESSAAAERNALKQQNDHLTNLNSTLTTELDQLSSKIDIVVRRNVELASELERRNKICDQLELDFKTVIESRNRISEEVDSLKQQLNDLQLNFQNSSTGVPVHRRLKGKSSEKLVPGIRRQIDKSLIKLARPTSFSRKTPSKEPLITDLTNKKFGKDDPSFVQDIEKSTVQKLVRNIQSGFNSPPIPPVIPKPYIFVSTEKNESAETTIKSKSSDLSARNAAFESIREILENKMNASSGTIDFSGRSSMKNVYNSESDEQQNKISGP